MPIPPFRSTLLITALLVAEPTTGAPGASDPPPPPPNPFRASAPVAPLPQASSGRPEAQGPPAPPQIPGPGASMARAADPTEVEACMRLMAGGTIKAERLPAIAGDGGCGIAAPLRVSAVVLPDGRSVLLEPPVTVGCRFAEAFVAWVRDDLTPLVRNHGGIVKVLGSNGYQCRGRNRIEGAKMSEHGLGNAMDLTAMVLGDGTIAQISKTEQASVVFSQIKLTACARFTTVLGPGSDNFHEDSLHLDVATRRNVTHFCRWRLPPL